MLHENNLNQILIHLQKQEFLYENKNMKLFYFIWRDIFLVTSRQLGEFANHDAMLARDGNSNNIVFLKTLQLNFRVLVITIFRRPCAKDEYNFSINQCAFIVLASC